MGAGNSDSPGLCGKECLEKEHWEHALSDVGTFSIACHLRPDDLEQLTLSSTNPIAMGKTRENLSQDIFLLLGNAMVKWGKIQRLPIKVECLLISNHRVKRPRDGLPIP